VGAAAVSLLDRYRHLADEPATAKSPSSFILWNPAVASRDPRNAAIHWLVDEQLDSMTSLLMVSRGARSRRVP
jgi:hypothetical protein